MQISKLFSIIEKKYLILIILIYFFFRIPNLTIIPPFNDESIYIDWASRMTREPGNLFYSLHDSKQPLLMWLFGISIGINSSDPIFASRVISVFFGLATLLGIYKISMKYIGRKTAIISSLIYIFIPLFIFFDRQALMESALAAFYVWSCYFTLKAIETKRKKHFLFLGIFLGLGYLVKSTALIFLFSSILLFIINFYKNKFFITKNIFFLLLIFFLINLLLFLQPTFWNTLGSNSRYVLTPKELLGFPFSVWVGNIYSNITIGFLYLTPIIFFTGLLGIYLFYRKDKFNYKNIIFYFLFSIFLQLIFSRGINQRYAVSFFPLFSIFSGYFFVLLFIYNKKLAKFIIAAFFAMIICLSAFQIVYPIRYLEFTKNLPSSEYSFYVSGSTSGTGLDRLKEYLINISRNEQLIVGFAVNAGNPESFLNTAFLENKNITVSYLDRSLFPQEIDNYDCLNAGVPVYFVSRRSELAGLDRFFQRVNIIKNPYSSNYYGIWKIKQNCGEKTLNVSLIKN